MGERVGEKSKQALILGMGTDVRTNPDIPDRKVVWATGWGLQLPSPRNGSGLEIKQTLKNSTPVSLASVWGGRP